MTNHSALVCVAAGWFKLTVKKPRDTGPTESRYRARRPASDANAPATKPAPHQLGPRVGARLYLPTMIGEAPLPQRHRRQVSRSRSHGRVTSRQERKCLADWAYRTR